MRKFVWDFLFSLKSYSQADLRKVTISELPQDSRNVENISMAFRFTDSFPNSDNMHGHYGKIIPIIE